jgi:hypothetical protein
MGIEPIKVWYIDITKWTYKNKYIGQENWWLKTMKIDYL